MNVFLLFESKRLSSLSLKPLAGRRKLFSEAVSCNVKSEIKASNLYSLVLIIFSACVLMQAFLRHKINSPESSTATGSSSSVLSCTRYKQFLLTVPIMCRLFSVSISLNILPNCKYPLVNKGVYLGFLFAFCLLHVDVSRIACYEDILWKRIVRSCFRLLPFHASKKNQNPTKIMKEGESLVSLQVAELGPRWVGFDDGKLCRLGRGEFIVSFLLWFFVLVFGSKIQAWHNL